MPFMSELYLIHYCHPDCEPFRNIMRLPEEEAFALAREMAATHPDASAFHRFADFPSYHPRRKEADGILHAAFRMMGGKPKQEHPLSFTLEGSDYLDGWFDRGAILRLPLASVPREQVSFTLGDSLGMLDNTGGFTMLTVDKLEEMMATHPGGPQAFLKETIEKYHYIEAQLWDDAPCAQAEFVRR